MANIDPTTTVPQWTVGDRLAKALTHAEVSVQEMADELGVNRNTVGNYLSGRTNPRRATLAVWALRCGVPHEWLAHGVEPSGNGPGTPGDQQNPHSS